MHAYLIVGESQEEKEKKVKELTNKLKAKTFEFPINKIADTRELRTITKLSFSEITAITISDIDNATEEALNAFLKNLEEPQENLYYILTASGARNVLPTIVSRCEVIKLQGTKTVTTDEEIKKFLNLTTGKKLLYIDKIKDRGLAKEFVQDLIEFSHFNLLNSDSDKVKTANVLEILVKTLNNLKSNGNVGLQLANMVISMD